MPKLLLNLRNVPEDEAAEVRELLDGLGVDWYETRPSIWGVSHGGLWLREESRYADVKARLDDYQRERQARARAEWDEAVQRGVAPTFADQLRAQPVRTILALGFAALLVVLTVALPYWYLRG